MYCTHVGKHVYVNNMSLILTVCVPVVSQAREKTLVSLYLLSLRMCTSPDTATSFLTAHV